MTRTLPNRGCPLAITSVRFAYYAPTRSTARRVQMGQNVDYGSLPERVQASAEGARTRGINMLAALAYVRRRGGRDAISKVLKRMDAEHVTYLLGDASGVTAVSSRGWYPVGTYYALLRAIDAEFGTGDLSLLHEVGYQMAKRDIKSVFRPLLRIGNPGWVFGLSSKLWRTYHDRGHWVLERTPVSLIATMENHPERDEAACTAFMGWMRAALEMSGAISVDGSHPTCQARGAAHCVFTVRWELSTTDRRRMRARTMPRVDTD